jgi:hypothetical protein
MVFVDVHLKICGVLGDAAHVSFQEKLRRELSRDEMIIIITYNNIYMLLAKVFSLTGYVYMMLCFTVDNPKK